MPDLINSQELITIDFLRKCFHENDFTTIPVIDQLEYDESELKLYNCILTIVNTELPAVLTDFLYLPATEKMQSFISTAEEHRRWS